MNGLKVEYFMAFVGLRQQWEEWKLLGSVHFNTFYVWVKQTESNSNEKHDGCL